MRVSISKEIWKSYMETRYKQPKIITNFDDMISLNGVTLHEEVHKPPRSLGSHQTMSPVPGLTFLPSSCCWGTKLDGWVLLLKKQCTLVTGLEEIHLVLT